jgi:hypothetical protein
MSDPVLWKSFHVGLSSTRKKGYASLSTLVHNLFQQYPAITNFVKTASLFKIPVSYSVVRDLLKLKNLETLNVQYKLFALINSLCGGMISSLTNSMHFIVPGSLPNLTFFVLMERESPTEEQTREFNDLVHRAAPNIEQTVPCICNNVYHDIFSPIIVEVPLSCLRCGDVISGKCYECLEYTCDDCGNPYCDDCGLHICKECGKHECCTCGFGSICPCCNDYTCLSCSPDEIDESDTSGIDGSDLSGVEDPASSDDGEEE